MPPEFGDSGAVSDDRSETVARLEAELAQLKRLLADNSLAARLRQALIQGMTAAEIASPTRHDQLLDLILETAADVVAAGAGALFLVDEAAREIVCAAAFGGQADRVKGLRVPLGHGIAGGVALTALPLAVSDAQKDPRWAADIGKQVGYLPESLVCVPLFHGDRVTGVLELLDKQGSRSFSSKDLHLLGLFANQAAVAIEHSRIQRNITAWLAASVVPSDAALINELKPLGDSLNGDEAFNRSLRLARLVNEISRLGDRELQACEAVLNAFAAYSHHYRQRTAL